MNAVQIDLRNRSGKWEAWLNWDTPEEGRDYMSRRQLFLGERETWQGILNLVAQFTVGVTGIVEQMAKDLPTTPEPEQDYSARRYVKEVDGRRELAWPEKSHQEALQAQRQLERKIEENPAWKNYEADQMEQRKQPTWYVDNEGREIVEPGPDDLEESVALNQAVRRSEAEAGERRAGIVIRPGVSGALAGPYHIPHSCQHGADVIRTQLGPEERCPYCGQENPHKLLRCKKCGGLKVYAPIGELCSCVSWDD